MFRKILIANRGEIALRVIRSAREMGIQTVAIYSEADDGCLHKKFADEHICIGPPQSAGSYLNIPNIISAALVTGADAIHPGYGFLAESSEFASACQQSGITFIGPTPEQIDALGNKNIARQMVKKAGIPITDGSDSPVDDVQEALKLAEKIGFPVMIKAVAGGGGKGLRIVHDKSDFRKNFQIARSEAQASFNNPEVYLEKYIKNAHHIEVQILADQHGNVIHLGERECSVQRNHQKLLEETPSPNLDKKIRDKITAAAVRAMKGIGYSNVGTVEFLMDDNGKFYFLEVNTRIQVEHPITEIVTCVDIVKEQIKISAGEKIKPFAKNELKPRGHAIECRINAEDPDRGFIPSPGKITTCHFPGGMGVRIDTHIYTDYDIPPYYDSMLAKLIVQGRNRFEAIEKMKTSLEQFIIIGPKTTIPLHLRILSNEKFVSGNYTTNFLAEIMSENKGEKNAGTR